MNNFICEIRLKGIRSINKEIVIRNSDLVVRPILNIEDSNVKVIYGPNGSGKSGIVEAMKIYKMLVTGDSLN